jgi:SAM-dependent methyltransferase
MNIADAIVRCANEFPFDGYVNPALAMEGAHSNIARSVIRHLPPGSAILDVGCGPCDKTAVLQFLGYKCSGYDDLQDDWHKKPGNREKILSFINKCGIDFKQSNGGELPFEKNSFDMLMMHDILEHLHNSPRDMLNDLLELVKPDGLLFITVPNAVNIRKRRDVLVGKTNLPPFDQYYWHPDPWRGHIREYVRNDLLLLSDYLNLEVIELRSCDHMLGKVPNIVRPAYLLVTTFFKEWKDSWVLIARKKKHWTPKKVL